MRFLIILVSCFAVLYGGYWFVGSAAATRAATALLADLEAEGVDVVYDDIRTVGFPSRFDTTLTGLSLGNRAQTFGWQAPFFQIFALSYNPTHVIAVWPDRQSFDLPKDRVTLVSERLRASVKARPAPSVPLREATLEGTALRILSDNGWEIDLTTLLAAIRGVETAEDGTATYDAYGEITEISLPSVMLQRFASAGEVPAVADRLHVDGRITLDRPLDRHALAGPAPSLTQIELRGASLRWGDMSVSGAGTMSVDSRGTLEGNVALTITDWPQMLRLAQAAGAIDQSVIPSLERAMSALSDGGNQLSATLRFENGFTSLGPVPIGPAPQLR